MQNKNDIFKSNIIYGGSQIIQMLTTILRAKLIAVFLGSAGIGLNAIIQSVMLTVSNLASCGIMQSSVREMSRAKGADDGTKLSSIYSIFRKLVLIAGVLGLLICLLGAWPLSIVSLGSSSDAVVFIALGIGVFFYIFTHGEMAILQGTRSLVPLAKASIVGSLVSLTVCAPCYFYFGNNGIVISIIIGYFLYWIIYKYYTSKLHIVHSKVGYKEAIRNGKAIITLGFVLMIGSFMVSLFTYLMNISIRIIGSLNDVGLYQGAASITTQSIVVVIAVLASDFYPRLSAVTEDHEAHNSLVNQQIDIILLIIVPIIAIIICFSDWIVHLLLTDEFVVIIPLLQFMSMSLLFRGLWITMSYVILAHGDRKRYLIYDAILGNGLNYLVNIVAYYVGGLTLLGISYVASSIVICAILYKVTAHSYGFRFERNLVRRLMIAILFIITTYCTYKFSYWGGIICMLCTVFLSLFHLITRFELLSILKIKIKKR